MNLYIYIYIHVLYIFIYIYTYTCLYVIYISYMYIYFQISCTFLSIITRSHISINIMNTTLFLFLYYLCNFRDHFGNTRCETSDKRDQTGSTSYLAHIYPCIQEHNNCLTCYHAFHISYQRKQIQQYTIYLSRIID